MWFIHTTPLHSLTVVKVNSKDGKLGYVILITKLVIGWYYNFVSIIISTIINNEYLIVHVYLSYICFCMAPLQSSNAYTNAHSNIKTVLKMSSPSGDPRCRWVCFFIRTDLETFSMTSLVHQWIICSEWVPSEWESKQLINITIIHK